MTIQISGPEGRRLAKAHADFMAKLRGLPEKRQRAIIQTTAANMFGSADPYTVALARQMQDVIDANGRIEAAQKELAEIESADLSGYRPADPNYRGRMLARAEDLREKIAADAARALAISEDPLSRAKEDAVAYFREADAQAAKTKAILDAADSLRAEAAARDAERRARQLVNAERTAAGKDPLPDDD